jgi:aryl-alcohol dehydrogenase-like predicted oxidoreductase
VSTGKVTRVEGENGVAIELSDRRPLGGSGIDVSVCGLGGNVFGGARLDRSRSEVVIKTALDLGVNFVDTANVYGGGESETYIGQALGSRRAEMVIATKFNLREYDGGPLGAHVRAQAEESLRRLGTDHIDLYQLHDVRPGVDADALLEVLHALADEGKIRAFGACNIAAWRVAEWRHAAESRGWAGPQTVQNYYHLLARQAEAEVLPYASGHGVGFLPYHPLAGGFLTGKYRFGEERPPGTRGAAGSPIINVMDTEANHRAVERLAEIAAREGRTLGELALAWVASRPGVTSVIAGVSNIEQLTLNVAGCTWKLGDDVLAEIDRVTAPTGVPSPERFPYLPGQRPRHTASTGPGGQSGKG